MSEQGPWEVPRGEVRSCPRADLSPQQRAFAQCPLEGDAVEAEPAEGPEIHPLGPLTPRVAVD